MGNGPGVSTSERIETALAELAELGWVRPAPERDGGGKGRQRADWTVNPALRDPPAVIAWRERLATLRAQPPASADKYVDAVSANSANSPLGGPEPPPIGAIGPIGIGIVNPTGPVEPPCGGEWDAVASALAEAAAAPDWPGSFLRSIARSVTAAVAEGAEREPDTEGCLALVRPDGRRLFVAPRTVVALTEACLLPPLPQEHAVDLQRPPAWSGPNDAPPPGAWCGCCGRFARSGGRWWREATAPTGWCCWDCHPPVHLAPSDVRDIRT